MRKWPGILLGGACFRAGSPPVNTNELGYKMRCLFSLFVRRQCLHMNHASTSKNTLAVSQGPRAISVFNSALRGLSKSRLGWTVGYPALPLPSSSAPFLSSFPKTKLLGHFKRQKQTGGAKRALVSCCLSLSPPLGWPPVGALLTFYWQVTKQSSSKRISFRRGEAHLGRRPSPVDGAKTTRERGGAS